MAISLVLQFGNKVLKEAEFVSNSSVVDSPEEGKKSSCPSDGDVAGKNDECIVCIESTEEVASWSGESVHENNSELLGMEIESECKTI